MKQLKDWQERALKTFIQAFFGVLIPEVVAVLNGTVPSTFEGWKLLLAPVLCSALASGISAAWNIIKGALENKE